MPISVEIGLHYFVKMTLDNYKFRLQSELNTCHKQLAIQMLITLAALLVYATTTSEIQTSVLKHLIRLYTNAYVCS